MKQIVYWDYQMLLKMAKARHLKSPLLNSQNSISIKHKNMPPTEAPPRLWLNNQLLHFIPTKCLGPMPACCSPSWLHPMCLWGYAQCLLPYNPKVVPNACCSSTTRHPASQARVCTKAERQRSILFLSNHLKSLAKQVIKSFPAPLCKWKGNGLPMAFLHLSTRAASTISNADVNKSRSNRVQYNEVSWKQWLQ